MTILKFNGELFAYDIAMLMLDTAKNIMNDFYSDVHLKATDNGHFGAVYDGPKKRIYDYCYFYGYSIIESYGTGQKSDITAEVLQAYMNSPLWNPYRKGLMIVGRERGEYTNFFGQTVYSAGTRAGVPMPGLSEPGNKEIQNAERRLAVQIDRKIEEAVRAFFDKLEPGKYFYNVNV